VSLCIAGSVDPAPSASHLFASTTLFRSKAVDDAYPLRGSLRVSTETGEFAGLAQKGPRPGAVWADNQLLGLLGVGIGDRIGVGEDRKSTRLNSSHVKISYAVFCLKKKNE